jgi:DedD protein
MANQNSGLRFDSREIAVIFSLFIFVSMLMFTVGILVGKGLAQAKFEGSPVVTTANGERNVSSEGTGAHSVASTGTSVSSNPPIVASKHEATPKPELEKTHSPAHSASEIEKPAHSESHGTEPEHKPELKALSEEYEMDPHPAEPLELKPKKSHSPDIHKEITADLVTPESEEVLRNPKLKELFEPDGAPVKLAEKKKQEPDDIMIEQDFSKATPKRSVASVSEKMPPSYASGAYSVQIAAYSEESQAAERVQALKKLGFPHAYFSAKELGENKETWYRVWLGFYPSFESAKASGDSLQARGEVKNYLVRKSEISRP